MRACFSVTVRMSRKSVIPSNSRHSPCKLIFEFAVDEPVGTVLLSLTETMQCAYSRNAHEKNLTVLCMSPAASIFAGFICQSSASDERMHMHNIYKTVRKAYFANIHYGGKRSELKQCLGVPVPNKMTARG